MLIRRIIMVSKKLLSFFTAICLVFGSASVLPNAFAGSETSITASAATVSGDYEYSVNEGFVRIEKYNGKPLSSRYRQLSMESPSGSSVRVRSKIVRALLRSLSLKALKLSAIRHFTAVHHSQT